MSWFDDNAFDGYWPRESTDPTGFRNYEWQSKSGGIELRDMTDSHLFNAYNMCVEEEVQELMMKEMTYRLFEERAKK